jgi:HEAT repeat protein
MGLRDELMDALNAADVRGVERIAVADPRATRHLLGRLWDPDSETRRVAAIGLGAAAASHTELGRDVVRRLMWALNDESATNGVYGLAALGEIGARCPELIRPFVAPIASYAWDDGLRSGILRALSRIADAAPDLVRPEVARVREFVTGSDPEERKSLNELISKTREGHDTN